MELEKERKMRFKAEQQIQRLLTQLKLDQKTLKIDY